MPFKLIFQLSTRNVWRQKRRNLIMLSAIVIAIAGVFSMNTLARGMTGDIISMALDNLTGHIKVLASGYLDNPGIENSFIARNEEMAAQGLVDVQGWANRIVVPSVVMSERNTRGIQLVGINPADEEISFYKDLEIEGEPLEDSADKGVVIGADLATELETKLGRKIVLVSQTIDGTSAEIGLKVKGIFTSETASLEKIYAFTGIDYVKEVLDTPNVTEVSLRLNVNESMGVNQAKLAELYPDLEVLNWSQMDPLAFQMYEYSSFAVYMLLVVILSTLVFGLVNTLVTAVLERIREFGLLRAVGMRSSAVVVQVVIESVLMMVVALILGLGLGYLIYLSMANGIDLGDYSEAMELMGMNSVLVPEIHVDDVLTIVCFSLILSFVASLIPARRAVKMKLLDALR